MRKLLLLSLSLMSFAVLAETPSVKITSYIYVNQDRKVAELCGVVSNATTTPTFIQITVDETSKRPATYNTLAGPDGKFCAVVVSYYGTAVAKAL